MKAWNLLNGAGMQWKGKNEGLDPPEWAMEGKNEGLDPPELGWDAMEGQE